MPRSGDISNLTVDAILLSTNENMDEASGLNTRVIQSAGPEYVSESKSIGVCRTGEVKTTQGYNLPCRYVLYCIVFVWRLESMSTYLIVLYLYVGFYLFWY